MGPAVPTNEMATEIARNVKHSHCVMRGAARAVVQKPLANAAKQRYRQRPNHARSDVLEDVHQAHGVAGSVASARGKLTIHSDISRIWG